MARPHDTVPHPGRARLAPAGAIAIIAGLGLGGCAGSGDGLDSTGRPTGEGGDTGTPLTADFDSIQTHVFTPICSVCHAGGAAPLGLRLDATNSYALLVGVPSVELPSLQRVRAGDPDASYLVQKIEGHASVGGRMPLGGPPLPDATIAVIRQWITDGAQRPASATTSFGKPDLPAAPRLESSVPQDQEVVVEPVAPIVLGFDRPLDATRVDAATLRLERLSPGSAPELVAANVTLADGDDWTVLIAPVAPLVAGQYRVVTGGPGTSLAGLDNPQEAPTTIVLSFGVEVPR
jgi:hypothetical protein